MLGLTQQAKRATRARPGCWVLCRILAGASAWTAAINRSKAREEGLKGIVLLIYIGVYAVASKVCEVYAWLFKIWNRSCPMQFPNRGLGKRRRTWGAVASPVLNAISCT